MKERIGNLFYDFTVLTIVGIAAFGGQVFANHVSLFGHSPVVNRLQALEERQANTEAELTRKIGF